jgi:hypothetical protein
LNIGEENANEIVQYKKRETVSFDFGPFKGVPSSGEARANSSANLWELTSPASVWNVWHWINNFTFSFTDCLAPDISNWHILQYGMFHNLIF